MSFFDDASLVFLPSGQAGKDGKAYSMKPTNGDGDFTFSRGSNLTATRVDSNGLIEKGRENLFKQSNNFNTTPWASSVTLTSGQSGYDGSNDAWLLTKTSSGAKSVYNYINETGVMTMSVYAKAGSANWMRLTQGGKTAYFDLSGSGAVGTSSNGIDQTITSVGNGWFRCTLTANKTTAGQTPIYPYTAEGDASGSTDSIYIQDSQLEQGLVATEYIESGASTGLAGILEDSPRFDYSGGASCPSLLLEPSRTNLVPYSEWIDSSVWTLTTASVSISSNLSPDGYANCTRVERTSSTNSYVRIVVPITSGETYTTSVYVRKVSGGDIFKMIDANGNSFSRTLTTEWQRFFITTTNSTAGRVYFQLGQDGDVVEMWGAQFELGSYPTSYIPNHSGGSVTREADSCNTSYVTTQSSVTYYVEFKVDSVDEEQQVLHLYNSADQYGLGVTIDFNNSNSGVIGIRGRNQRTTTDFGITSFSGLTANTNYKLAFVVDWSNETITNARLNGNTSDSVISARVTTINGLYLGSRADNYFISGNIGQFLVFPSALSVPEIITLTS